MSPAVKRDIEALEIGQHVIFTNRTHSPTQPNVEYAFHRGASLAAIILNGVRKACIEVVHGQQPTQNVVLLFERAEPELPIDTRYEFESRVKVHTPSQIVGNPQCEASAASLTYIEASVLVRRIG